MAVGGGTGADGLAIDAKLTSNEGPAKEEPEEAGVGAGSVTEVVRVSPVGCYVILLGPTCFE